MAEPESEHEPEDVNPSMMRPRDLALLLLATSHEPPRARARDQQADRAGGALRRRVLDRLVLEDPEPEALEASLSAIVAEFGDPSGPTRGVCSMIRQEWAESRLAPGYWTWLLSEALAQGDRDRGSRRRRSDGPEPAP
jgi:hypothetical protein